MTEVSDEDESEEPEEEQKKATGRSIFIIPSRKKLDENKKVKAKKTKISRREKRREVSRRTRSILNPQKPKQLASLPFFRDLHVDYFLSPQLVKMYQVLLISVYGAYAVMAIAVLTFYILDLEMQMFDGDFLQNASYIMPMFLLFNLFLAVLGCYVSFKFGVSEDGSRILEEIKNGLNTTCNECQYVSAFMMDDGHYLLVTNDSFVTKQSEVKYELNATIHRLNKLGKTLNEYAQHNKNEEMKRVQHFVQIVYQQLYVYSVEMRALQDRSKIWTMFYAKIVEKERGLNENEFDQLVNSLDNESSDDIHGDLKLKLPHFRKFDKNKDHMVNLMEFEEELDRIYLQILNDIEQNYEQNKSPEDLAFEKEQRAKESKAKRALMRNFRKYIKKKNK